MANGPQHAAGTRKQEYDPKQKPEIQHIPPREDHLPKVSTTPPVHQRPGRRMPPMSQ